MDALGPIVRLKLFKHALLLWLLGIAVLGLEMEF